MGKPHYHSISDIVATVYCERQAVLDRQFGQARTPEVAQKAAHGTAEHRRFEMEGKRQQASDRRCFIASAVYGVEAPQTNALRDWRDRMLMPSRLGRVLVRCYYAWSPRAVRLVERFPWMAAVARRMLDRLLSWIGRQ